MSQMNTTAMIAPEGIELKENEHQEDTGMGGKAMLGPGPVRSRITVSEIAQRLAIGEMAVYRMLDEKIIPAVRVGKRWVVTRKAFEKWEESCGIPGAPERVQ